MTCDEANKRIGTQEAVSSLRACGSYLSEDRRNLRHGSYFIWLSVDMSQSLLLGHSSTKGLHLHNYHLPWSQISVHFKAQADVLVSSIMLLSLWFILLILSSTLPSISITDVFFNAVRPLVLLRFPRHSTIYHSDSRNVLPWQSCHTGF